MIEHLNEFIGSLIEMGLILDNFKFSELSQWAGDENELIFFLSNYFQSLTPAQYFEVSKRLVNNFIQKKSPGSVRDQSSHPPLLSSP